MNRALLLTALLACPSSAQRHEIGLLLGGFKPASRTLETSPPTRADFRAGMTFYANYGFRFAGSGESPAALYFELPFTATPQNKIRAESPLATRDVATIYITPGIRLKFAPGRRLSPYVAAGAGYALFEHSLLRADGRANDAPRTLGRAAFQFGGGFDLHVWRRFGLRGEIRDFASGSPNLNAPLRGSLQHNLLLAGGFSLRF